MTDPNDPAFPKLPLNQGDQGISYPGLTKREYFAALALQGILAHAPKPDEYQYAIVSVEAVTFADALIAELNKGKGLQ